MNSPTGTWWGSVGRTVKLTRRLGTTASKLNNQALTHEFGAVERGVRLTRDDITSVHRVLVFNKAKAVHELDVDNLPSAMGSKVVCDILFCGVTWKVAQVEPSRGDVAHCDGWSCMAFSPFTCLKSLSTAAR